MPIFDDIEKYAGPAPEAPRGLISPATKADYHLKRQIYEDVVKRMSGELIDRALTPMSAKDFSDITGYDPSVAGDPLGMKQVTREEPSLVPKSALHYTREGDRPMGMTLTPQTVEHQGPGDGVRNATGDVVQKMILDQVQYGSPDTKNSGMMRGYAERDPGLFSEGMRPRSTMLVPSVVGLQGPPNPAGPEFYDRPGDPLQTTTTEFDPNTPASPVQRHLAAANIKREGTWPRSITPPGGQTLQWKMAAVDQLVSSGVPREAAIATVFGGEPLPGGKKADNLDARTNSSNTRADLMGSQKSLTDKKADSYDQQETDRHRAADDKHANQEWMQRFREKQLEATIAHQRAAQRASQDKDTLGWERLNEIRHWHDRLGALAGAMDKPGLQTEEQRKDWMRAYDILSGATEREPSPEEMGFLEKIFGTRPRLQYTPRPPIGPTGGSAPQPATQAQPSQQSQTGPQPFSDAPPGKTKGQILTKDGKAVADWDGTKWVPR